MDVRLEEENVWLTQKLTCLRRMGRQVAALFQTAVPNIYMHLKNIYEEGELEEKATIQGLLTSSKSAFSAGTF